MDATTWNVIVSALSDADSNVCVRAAERLHAESSVDEIQNLLALLKSNDFFVREAAAWPLATLAGPTVLVDLFAAYQRGIDDEHDNDGFTAALLEIPGLHGLNARIQLEQLLVSANGAVRSHASWLLDFCKNGIPNLWSTICF